jgi:hypothetical protein
MVGGSYYSLSLPAIFVAILKDDSKPWSSLLSSFIVCIFYLNGCAPVVCASAVAYNSSLYIGAVKTSLSKIKAIDCTVLRIRDKVRLPLLETDLKKM